MSVLIPLVSRAVQCVRQLCFAPRCSFCDVCLPPQRGDVARYCASCAAATQWLPHPIPLRGGDASVRLHLAHALCRYDGPVVDALHRLKFGDRPDAARGLAALLAPCLDPRPFDAIVPVPLGAARLRQRGYNQTALLARDLARARAQQHSWRTAEPVQAWLYRTRDTPPQVGQSAAARRANLRGAFALAVPAVVVARRRILLIDDVLTTGTTITTCAMALHRAGADVAMAVIAVA